MSGSSAVERARAVSAFDPLALERRASTSTADDDLPVLAHGVGASPGRGLGAAYFSVESALAALDRGEAVVLIAEVTSPADEPAMRHVAGVVTAQGGTTSHAAIVARGWGVPAVCGVATLRFEGALARFGDVAVREGDALVVDGSSGLIFRPTSAGVSPPTGPPEDLSDEVAELLGWADEISAGRVEVLANADSPHDAAVARRLGAGGVGLSRSEHWYSGEHSAMITELLTEDSPGDSAPLLDRFAARTRKVAKSLLAELAGAPLTVRLLDAPPEEFGLAVPGRRGVQLARVRSDIYRTQLRALVEAAGSPRTQAKCLGCGCSCRWLPTRTTSISCGAWPTRRSTRCATRPTRR